MWRLKGTLLVCFLSTPPLDHVEAITVPLKHPGTGSLDPPQTPSPSQMFSII